MWRCAAGWVTLREVILAALQSGARILLLVRPGSREDIPAAGSPACLAVREINGSRGGRYGSHARAPAKIKPSRSPAVPTRPHRGEDRGAAAAEPVQTSKVLLDLAVTAIEIRSNIRVYIKDGAPTRPNSTPASGYKAGSMQQLLAFDPSLSQDQENALISGCCLNHSRVASRSPWLSLPFPFERR